MNTIAPKAQEKIMAEASMKKEHGGKGDANGKGKGKGKSDYDDGPKIEDVTEDENTPTLWTE